MNDSLGGKLSYAIGAVTGAFLSLPLMIQTVLALMFIDFATGLLGGAYQKNLSSERARKGLIRKGMALLVILGAAVLARGLAGLYDFDASMVVTFVSGAYSVYELVSILENARTIGLPIPQWLVDKLAVIRKEFPLEKLEAEETEDADATTDHQPLTP